MVNPSLYSRPHAHRAGGGYPEPSSRSGYVAHSRIRVCATIWLASPVIPRMI
jgi:hypothetical protein